MSSGQSLVNTAIWDARYGVDEYVYGTQANDFLRSTWGLIRPGGSVLSLGEGEGRNGVFLAEQGLSVLGVDASGVGLDKARRLAASRGVVLQTERRDLASGLPDGRFDAIVLIFCHLPPPIRRRVLSQVADRLAPGGVLILEAYTPDQLHRKTGGPPSADLMYTRALVQTEVSGLEWIVARERERPVLEGQLHNGISAVVQMVGWCPDHPESPSRGVS